MIADGARQREAPYSAEVAPAARHTGLRRPTHGCHPIRNLKLLLRRTLIHDKHCAVNQQSYPKDFAPVYAELGLSPTYLLQFPIILPIHLPLPDGVCTTFEIDDKSSATLVFSTVSTTRRFEDGLIEAPSIDLAEHRTRVEMVHVVEGERPAIDSDELSVAFDTLLVRVNAVITGYRLHSEDLSTHPVSREMLELGCVVRLVPVHDWAATEHKFFLLHSRFPIDPPVMAMEAVEKTLWYGHIVLEGRNPFTLAAELRQTAKRYAATGQYGEAIIFSQTSVEMFLGTLLSELLALEGRTADEITDVFENTAFVSRVKREYHSRLGGHWNPDASSSAIGEWYSHTYSVRNRVIHAGYRPTIDEVRAALVSTQGFIDFIIQRLRRRKRQYGGILELVDPKGS